MSTSSLVRLQSPALKRPLKVRLTSKVAHLVRASVLTTEGSWFDTSPCNSPAFPLGRFYFFNHS